MQKHLSRRLKSKPLEGTALVPTSPSVVSEATAENRLRRHQNLRRSLLIQRLEGSRPAVRSGAGSYGFSIGSMVRHEMGNGPACLVGEEECGLKSGIAIKEDGGWNRFWVRDKNFFRRQGAGRRIEPKEGSRFAVFGNWFHAATPAREGGERSWIWAAVSLSMTAMGPRVRKSTSVIRPTF